MLSATWEARDDTPLPRLRPGSIGTHAQLPSIGCPKFAFRLIPLARNTRHPLLTNRLRCYEAFPTGLISRGSLRLFTLNIRGSLPVTLAANWLAGAWDQIRVASLILCFAHTALTELPLSPSLKIPITSSSLNRLLFISIEQSTADTVIKKWQRPFLSAC